MAFGCPRCGTVSQSPSDEAEGYCANCHDVTGGEPVAMGLLPHFTVFELRDLLSMVVPRSPLATAIHEAILHASAHHHRDALSQLGTLRRHLETMTLRVGPVTPTLNGHRMFDKVLSVVEQFVRDHARLQGRFGEVNPDDTLPLGVIGEAPSPAEG